MKKIIKNITPIFIGVCFIFSSCVLHAQNNKKLDEITHNLNRGQLYDEINLSNLGLTEMPDLSAYSIKKLDLSHNIISKFKQDFLPGKLEYLNISHNEIEPDFIIKGVENCQKLEELNISFNKIQIISFGCKVSKLDVNNNLLTLLAVGSKGLDYLDISNNPNLSATLQFDPAKIKTIKRQNIASNDPLEFVLKKNRVISTFKAKSITKERP